MKKQDTRNPAEDQASLADHQEDRMVQDPWFDKIATWLNGRDPMGQSAVSVADVLAAINVEKAKWTPSDERRVAKIMQMLGRVRVRRQFASGLRAYVYDRACSVGDPSVPPGHSQEEAFP
jgi:hypothetical protein